MPGIRKTGLVWAAAVFVALALSAWPAGATSRIKDLANIEGVRQNQLIGYGLVVGLNGTGDTLNNIPFTKQSLQAMLERMGVNIRGATIRTGNVAAVMVTGNLPAFGTQGTRMDVTVSALGDAKNLTGGTSKMLPNHHITKPVFIGEIKGNGQFDVVWKTPGLVPGDAWSDYLPESKMLEADWTAPINCGNYNTETKTCGGAAQ